MNSETVDAREQISKPVDGESVLNAGLAADSKRALELIGSIFHCGNFIAETSNERELEIILRKHGYFIETAEQFDNYCRKVHAANVELTGGLTAESEKTNE